VSAPAGDGGAALGEALAREALALGFSDVGVCAPGAIPEAGAALRRWVV
jgi:hypothetical protein